MCKRQPLSNLSESGDKEKMGHMLCKASFTQLATFWEQKLYFEASFLHSDCLANKRVRLHSFVCFFSVFCGFDSAAAASFLWQDSSTLFVVNK